MLTAPSGVTGRHRLPADEAWRLQLAAGAAAVALCRIYGPFGDLAASRRLECRVAVSFVVNGSLACGASLVRDALLVGGHYPTDMPSIKGCVVIKCRAAESESRPELESVGVDCFGRSRSQSWSR